MAEAATRPGLKVQIGRQTVDASDGRAVDAAIAAHNASVRIEGLVDTLNPNLIDGGKAHALLGAIVALAPDKRRGFDRKALYLNAPDLPLAPGAPSTAAGLAKLDAIEATEVQGGSAFARVSVALDCGLAEKQAAAAKAAFEALGPEVTRLDAARRTRDVSEQSKVLHELAAVRSRRHAAARTWQSNAHAVATCAPSEASKADAAAADAAAQSSAVPSGPGMR